MNQKENENMITAFLFILIPTIMILFSYFFIPYPFREHTEYYLFIPMFLGLIFLGIGFLIKKIPDGSIFKIFGWIIFAFYWSTQPTKLYLSEGNDLFNSAVCVIGIYVLCYFAYHEWLSIKRKENMKSLNWIAGASALAGIIYFGIEQTFLADWLTNVVAYQSAAVLNAIIGNAHVPPGTTNIFLDGHYVVTIIFACTAIQAMVIFVGMIGALPKIDIIRRVIGLIITVVPIYILNLFRNAMVAFLVGRNITSFTIAHNVISKIGALITLIVLLLLVIKIIPEIYDEIISLTDIYKRNGPLEKMFKKIIGRKN